MKKSFLSFVLVLSLLLILFIAGCKTADESDTAADKFTIVDVSGYSLQVTVVPKNPKDDSTKYTSLNLFAAIRNDSESVGTITDWAFQIKRDIVTILEINAGNFQNYNLEMTGNTALPAEEIIELFVGTPLPFYANALPEDVFIFDPYIPTDVVLTITVVDSEGGIHEVTAKGAYTFEESTVNED